MRTGEDVKLLVRLVSMMMLVTWRTGEDVKDLVRLVKMIMLVGLEGW